jgi:hypothetical protein
MALPYPNLSLSEMAAEEEFRAGSIRSSDAQPLHTKQHPPRKTALRRVVLTIMCVRAPVFYQHALLCKLTMPLAASAPA